MLFFIVAFIFLSGSNMDFLSDQKKNERVRNAFDEKKDIVTRQLKTIGLMPDDFHLLVVAYKDEDRLELFAKKKSSDTYRLLISYDVCARSGTLGPKRRQGDGQVPEGFYHIDRFNPKSKFHLSLGVDYPNRSDRIKSTSKDPGGDIFIHGDCVTIGCLPMTDDKIKEIYIYAAHAKNNGQHTIPVYIFPFQMTDANMSKYALLHDGNPEMVAFWKQIKPGYDRFSSNHQELAIKINSHGDYVF